MAGSLNRVTIIGHLGKDPETKSFQNGGKVVNFSVATSESWKDRNSGERKEKTEWHNVAVFQDGLTDICEKYLRKGSKVFVEGKLQTRKWQDNAGADRYSTEIVLQGFDAKILLLDGKSDSGRVNDDASYGQDRRSAQSAHTETRATAAKRGAFDSDLDDDVPF